MIKSRFCDLVGVKYPIIQAGMGPFPTTNLCIATSNAGVLGLITSSGGQTQKSKPEVYAKWCESADGSVNETSEELLRKMYIKVFEQTKATGGIFGVNVMVAEEMRAWAEICINTMLKLREEEPEMKKRFKVLFTSAGDPLPWTDTIKPHDGLIWTHIVPSVKGALRCKKAGVNIIVASGHEGGFHTSWEPVHSMILLPDVVDKVSDENTLIVGAGGYCDGKTLAAALIMGADGVQMGTRFLSTQESDFAPLWKQAVVEAGDRGTLVARGFVGPARWVKNAKSIEHQRNTLKDSPGVFLGEPDSENPQTLKLIDFENAGIIATLRGDKPNAMMAAGESSQRIDDMPPAKEVIDKIVTDAEKYLKGSANLVS